MCIIIIYEVINQGLEGWDDKGALDDKGPTKSVHHYRDRDSDVSINYYIFFVFYFSTFEKNLRRFYYKSIVSHFEKFMTAQMKINS